MKALSHESIRNRFGRIKDRVKSGDDKGKVIEFYHAAKNSGISAIDGATTLPGMLEPIQLILLDSGVTSVGLAHKNPNGNLNLIYKGNKHDGVPYYTNTFLRFKSKKPRKNQ